MLDRKFVVKLVLAYKRRGNLQKIMKIMFEEVVFYVPPFTLNRSVIIGHATILKRQNAIYPAAFRSNYIQNSQGRLYQRSSVLRSST